MTFTSKLNRDKIKVTSFNPDVLSPLFLFQRLMSVCLVGVEGGEGARGAADSREAKRVREEGGGSLWDAV